MQRRSEPRSTSRPSFIARYGSRRPRRSLHSELVSEAVRIASRRCRRPRSLREALQGAESQLRKRRQGPRRRGSYSLRSRRPRRKSSKRSSLEGCASGSCPAFRSCPRPRAPPGSQSSPRRPSGFGFARVRNRIVYAVDDERRIVEVVKIVHRREVYASASNQPSPPPPGWSCRIRATALGEIESTSGCFPPMAHPRKTARLRPRAILSRPGGGIA